ncbi:hypothetical protein SAMN04487881_0071 [Marinobacter sp. es.048]|uniref:hypothetical protein n=1 Tax=Marinobacter sp. es.048 TaxID=1761795 RepID=UPI000B58F697|nr:hypothetical protein [Marinobacter sp. es.048]SNC59513.1 hypothetical protein SAMN04487881_0071 [Marinobacter sp. es.048]
MTASTETHTALAAMGSRILSAPSVFPQDHPLNDIYRDLSWIERKTLEEIVKAKRADSELVLNENNIMALTLLQERLYDKHQIDPFVATELKALAYCTGVDRPEITTVDEHGECDGSVPTHLEDPDPFSEDDSWGAPKWMRAANT